MRNKIHSTFKTNSVIGLTYKASKGFTIIELVLVIVLMGILSVTVAPKFFGSNGFEEYAYQAEVIATLRSIQLRAMQQTSIGSNECHTVIITSKLLTVDDNCAANSENSLGETLNNLAVEVDSNHSVTFIPDISFSFDSMGRPVSCSSPCEINFTGNDNLKVTIESEGFIHAE